MERRLFAMEEWIYRAGRRAHTPLPINFGIAVECTQQLSHQNLRAALDAAGEFFPLSRSHVILHEHERGTITTKDIQPIPLTYTKVDNVWVAIEKELPRLFNDPVLPLVRVHFYESPQGYFLYAHFDHALVDGIGALTWIQGLFAFLQGENPPASPLVPWEDIVFQNFRPEWEKNYHKTQPSLWDNIAHWCKQFTEPTWPDNISYSLLIQDISPEQTKHLRTTAKKHEASVHAALAMSFLQAFHELSPFHRSQQRTVLSPINLRTYYNLPKNSYGLLNGTIKTTVHFSQTTDFWKRCALFKKQLDTQLHNTDVLYYHYCVQKDLENALTSGFRRRYRFDTRKEYDLSLTNLGIAESPSFHGLVKGVYGPIAQGLPTETVLGVITFQDKMTLSWTSKPEFLPQDQSQALFQRGLEILQKNMCLSSQFSSTLGLAPQTPPHI